MATTTLSYAPIERLTSPSGAAWASAPRTGITPRSAGLQRGGSARRSTSPITDASGRTSTTRSMNRACSQFAPAGIAARGARPASADAGAGADELGTRSSAFFRHQPRSYSYDDRGPSSEGLRVDFGVGCSASPLLIAALGPARAAVPGSPSAFVMWRMSGGAGTGLLPVIPTRTRPPSIAAQQSMNFAGCRLFGVLPRGGGVSSRGNIRLPRTACTSTTCR